METLAGLQYTYDLAVRAVHHRRPDRRLACTGLLYASGCTVCSPTLLCLCVCIDAMQTLLRVCMRVVAIAVTRGKGRLSIVAWCAVWPSYGCWTVRMR